MAGNEPGFELLSSEDEHPVVTDKPKKRCRTGKAFDAANGMTDQSYHWTELQMQTSMHRVNAYR